ncbi:hypothetical protein Poli38472_001633 [Pythium oligandrum]|uniref:Uncharacterized protein n=1 Tax=Pythium oligandrum TaxID=41045 RepID=A0A8K1CV63_PYTOL|nr:hypothetical protein Poli38472_001633 [Pythium oligandrum]|eukprot:TMW69477.1 hypothetical protein Poli38472_001633 [Pythium oligandrum]
MRLLRFYPLLLCLNAAGGFALCQWFRSHDLRTRETTGDLSVKYLLTAAPQFLAALLLLFYACTFNRDGSEFAHRMLVESCLHQALTSLLMTAIVHSGFHMTHSGCCAFPSACPVDVHDCRFHAVFQCPQPVATSANFDFYPRLAQFIATCIITLSMMSITPVHVYKHLQSRVRHGELLTFSRHLPIRPASPTVRI